MKVFELSKEQRKKWNRYKSNHVNRDIDMPNKEFYKYLFKLFMEKEGIIDIPKPKKVKGMSLRNQNILDDYFINNKKQKDISALYGVSHQAVSRIIKIWGKGRKRKRKESVFLFSKRIKKNADRVRKFWSNFVHDVNTGCWEWQGSIHPLGYGLSYFFLYGKQEKTIHRISWILRYGEIPKGMYVCHKCDNRRCGKPEHLYLGTQKQNMKDREERFKGIPPYMRNKLNVPKRKVD